MKLPSIKQSEDRYDSFSNKEVLLGKKKQHLPAMGWNSWNAFGSNNTEKLTKIMADKIVELGLDKLGYKYVVLDDGCYEPNRVEGRLSNNSVKFSNGFKNLAQYIHEKGLKFGMYNDIGTKLCSGAEVGTCGFEEIDTRDYVNWGVDFIKVDNCYYPWDNATFSDPDNAKYVFAPNIRGIKISKDNYNIELSAVKNAVLTGTIGYIDRDDDCIKGIGTYDGTAPIHCPLDVRSSEIIFEVEVDEDGTYQLYVNYTTDKVEGTGSWLQVKASASDCLSYDDFLPETKDAKSFTWSDQIDIKLKAGKNKIRLMNHRRQENTLQSYKIFLQGLNKANPDHDIIFSICEWGKTQPQNWGYKVGDSWRILNDITFNVGDDGNNGQAKWIDDYTTSICSQYNKAVIMDEFSGLDRGWNDPDMLVIGMDGITDTMAKTHMALWCMMNSPLMLGLDLRRVNKDDDIYKIIANKNLIALNQDPLGVQAKRVFCSIENEKPDTTYVRDINRVDILAKPLYDNSIAICFVNLSEAIDDNEYTIDINDIVAKIGHKMVDAEGFMNAKAHEVTDLWTNETKVINEVLIKVSHLEGCAHVIYKINPMS